MLFVEGREGGLLCALPFASIQACRAFFYVSHGDEESVLLERGCKEKVVEDLLARLGGSGGGQRLDHLCSLLVALYHENCPK